MDFSFLDQLDVNAYAVDKHLNLLYINKKAAERYKNVEQLIGNSILSCHKEESSKIKIKQMLEEFAGGRREPFNYFLAKGDKTQHKVIFPFFKNGSFEGMLEFSFFVEDR